MKPPVNGKYKNGQNEYFEGNEYMKNQEKKEEKKTNFPSSIMTIRRDLLILRGYYDEIMDVGRALEENENR